MPESKFVGLCTCPVCNSPKARLSVSKSQLACVNCNSCNSQVFARSDRSDELLRARLVEKREPAAPPPAPVSAPAETKPKKEAEKKPAPAAAGGDDDWGM